MQAIEREELDATLVLRVAYDGLEFCGFAQQPTQRTVAGELRVALETFLRREVDITCAGRTDAGVHALSQFVSVPVTFDELDITQQRMERAFEALLPDDISVTGIYAAEKGFSARFDAVMRHYKYRIVTGPSRPLFTRNFAWYQRGALDVDAMEQAAAYFVGEHDYKSFCKAVSAVGKPTCRFVREVTLARSQEFGEDVLEINVVGNAFLHSMVRTMVGSLVEVGLHRREPAWIKQVLEACDRTCAGPCAPACGLTFSDVDYPEGALNEWPAQRQAN